MPSGSRRNLWTDITRTRGATSAEYADAAIRADLERAGTLIGRIDPWIAAHAKAEVLVLVTNNERQFKRIKGPKVDNWAA